MLLNVVMCSVLSLAPTQALDSPRSLFPFVQESKWGYIDRTGTVVIRAQFDSAGFFSEDLAHVRIPESRIRQSIRDCRRSNHL